MRHALLLLLLACNGGPEDLDPPGPEPEPGELEVGVARVRLPAPVGIGTAGFGGFGVSAEPSPFAEIYPATTRLHTHPDLRAMVISRGEGFEAIFLRTDTVGVFQQLRRAVVLELQERLGRDLDHALIIGATHTHAGPGRVIDAGGPFELITDRFHPEFYDNLVMAMADVVEMAWNDRAPGRVGFATGYTTDPINDRRCEDGHYENGTLPLVAVEREGALAGVLMAYPIHGTVIGISQLTLSQDVAGGIEAAVEDRLGALAGGEVLAMMMNSWGADMSPTDPGLPLQEGAAMPGGYQRIEAIGQAVADAVEAVTGDLAFTDAPEIRVQTHRTRINREVLGYASDEFKYPYGGVYCGAGLESDCDPTTNLYPEFDDACVPFPEAWPAPDQTELTVGRLGPLALVTFPGEPGTLLAEQVVGDILALEVDGVEEAMFLGYSQDYMGYSLLEDDYWLGGYEASGALWGPRQGEYLAEQAAAAFAASFAGGLGLSEPEPLAPFGGREFTPYAPPTPVGLGTVVEDVEPVYGPADTVVFTVAGSDPWLGAPRVELVDEAGQPVTRPGGQAVDSDGLAMWLDLAPDPPYRDGLDLPQRAFHWTVHLPVRRPVPGVVPELSGAYRLRVSLPAEGGPVVVDSSLFEVDPELFPG